MAFSRRFALAFVCFCAPLTFAAAPPTRIDCDRVVVLLRLLDDDDFEVRHKADGELRRMGTPVLPYLQEEELRTSSLEVRDRLRRIGRDLRADERVPELVKQLAHKDVRYRVHARHMLGQLGPDHLPALEAALLKGASPEASGLVKQRIAELKR